MFRVPSDDEEVTWEQPSAYVVDLQQTGARVHPVHSGGEGAPFIELSLQPTAEGYQAAARTQTGEVHAWAFGVPSGSPSSPSAGWTPLTPSSTRTSASRPPSRDSQPSSSSSPRHTLRGAPDGKREVTLCAPQVSELVELPHTRDTRLFPISVGVGCALCVSMEPDERARKRRGLGIMGLGLLGKGKGKERAPP
jgi:hypothetical protein